MVTVDRMAAVWSAVITAAAAGVALAASFDGPEYTAYNEPLTGSEMCESGGHIWREEFGYCYISVDLVCEALGGTKIRIDPYGNGVYIPICKLVDHEPTSDGEDRSPSALCESAGYGWREEGYCHIIQDVTCESMGGKMVCADQDSFNPNSTLILDVCRLVCEL